HLDVLFVQNLAVDEIDNGHVADVFNFEATATRLRGHTLTPSIPQAVHSSAGISAFDINFQTPGPRCQGISGFSSGAGPTSVGLRGLDRMALKAKAMMLGRIGGFLSHPISTFGEALSAIRGLDPFDGFVGIDARLAYL